jgi:hypothetical protein
MMDQIESGAHSFVVRIWVEEVTGKDRRATWRGHITHVPGGERHYVQDLNAIPLFIAPFLEKSGVRTGARWRLKKWQAGLTDQARRWLNR